MFKKRIANIYNGQKRRARNAGKELKYSLEEFREWATEAMKRPCPFCQGEVAATNISADHYMPICRGGEHDASNLVLCCERCNQIKGMMDGVEFSDLLQLIRNWTPKVKQNLLARLRAGGKLIRSKT